MGRTFSTRRGGTRVLFGAGCSGRIAAELEQSEPKPRRVLVVTTAGRRPAGDALASTFGERSAGVLAIAREHVPAETVAEANAFMAKADADALVALGGGSAIGLAKAVAVSRAADLVRQPPLPIVAVPTTYSGSEMTPVFGITEGGHKRTGRDERARPVLVAYDATLTVGLPRDVTVASLWNALAHAVEALWSTDDRAVTLAAEEAVRLIASSVVRLAEHLDDVAAREDAFEGAYLAGGAFADTGSGVHHKLCHVLGGSFGLPHAPTHAAMLPHVTRWMSDAAPAAMSALARALGAVDPVEALDRLAVATGVPRSLADLGFAPEGIARVVDAVLASPPPSLRAIDRNGITSLLERASAPAVPVRSFDGPAVRAPSELETQAGFGATHTSEALPGALPRTQNTPRPAPYGLYPDLLSGTPFTVENAQNSRVWMYRIRPSFAHGAFRPLPAAPFGSPLGAASPTRTRWNPLPIPEPPARVDFVDGLVTLGGYGDPAGPGYAVNLYAANADMVDRAFSTADGDLLVVPQHGMLDVRTELGFLRVPPGSVLVVPRGIKFAVGVPDGAARGWMLEVFGPRFRLPERGPIGSNGLADARHFLAPTASWEDRRCPEGFELVHKLGGRLHAATQECSPFDVVAWHGVHVPYAYDLSLFNAMGTATWDHPDPSIHTVLTAPLDEHGRAVVDFVAFRGRWDVAEHSFRPPFMHRNAASEINGVVSTSPGEDASYLPGCTFVSPLLTSHGISTRSYDAVLEMPDSEHEGPKRLPDSTLWIMFESALPFRFSEWARATPLVDRGFLRMFEGMKTRFDPTRI